MPALALGADPPEPGTMARPPRPLKEHVINRSLLLRAYLWLGLLQSLAVMLAFYFQFWMNGYWGQWLDLPSSGPLYESATAMALACVVTTQIGNLFAQRTSRTSVFSAGFFTNRMLWVGIASELVIIFLIVYLPFLQRTIGTESFALKNWLLLFALSPLLLIADEMRKALVRRRKKARRQETGDRR
jgi:magnesium-transporting ATPase (P-type)